MKKTILYKVWFAIMCITLPGWVAAQVPAPANVTTSIRYTLTAPASADWTAKDFDDSTWKETKDAERIPAAVPESGEIWIRIRCDLPWELINNTYAKIKQAGPVELYINGKLWNHGTTGSVNGWRLMPLSPHRKDQEGANVYALHGKGPTGLQMVHEPWVKTTLPDIKPEALIEEKLRDANVIRGGDGNYYMTGTFAGTEGDGLLFFDYQSGKHWKNNDGVKLYRSADLKSWTDLGWVWTFKNNATWCKEPFKSDDPKTNGKQGIFAPKFHYLNGKYIIVYGCNWSMPNHNWGVGIAVSDKPEGPYRETSPDKPICTGYDAQIFRDDDGLMYLIRNNGLLAKLKPDLSGLDGEAKVIIPENYPFVNFEGPGMIKRGDTYYVMGAEILHAPGSNSAMGCTMVASSKNIFGPYGKRYLLLSGAGGHTRPFQDEKGKWWTALWTWSRDFNHQFGITGIDFAADGTIFPTGEVIKK